LAEPAAALTRSSKLCKTQERAWLGSGGVAGSDAAQRSEGPCARALPRSRGDQQAARLTCAVLLARAGRRAGGGVGGRLTGLAAAGAALSAEGAAACGVRKGRSVSWQRWGCAAAAAASPTSSSVCCAKCESWSRLTPLPKPAHLQRFSASSNPYPLSVIAPQPAYLQRSEQRRGVWAARGRRHARRQRRQQLRRLRRALERGANRSMAASGTSVALVTGGHSGASRCRFENAECLPAPCKRGWSGRSVSRVRVLPRPTCDGAGSWPLGRPRTSAAAATCATATRGKGLLPSFYLTLAIRGRRHCTPHHVYGNRT
jgi:hypothetical protein